MDTVFSRMRKIIESMGISNNEFGRNIGCSNAQITQMLTHEKNFGIDKMLKIISAYPKLSPEWLLTGKGEMLHDNKVHVTPASVIDCKKNKGDDNDASIQDNSYIVDKFFQKLEEKNREIKELYKENGFLEAANSTIKAETENLYAEIARLKAQIEALEKREKSNFPAGSQSPAENSLSEVPASMLMTAEPETEYRRRK